MDQDMQLRHDLGGQIVVLRLALKIGFWGWTTEIPVNSRNEVGNVRP
jgi:hypothetical protein